MNTGHTEAWAARLRRSGGVGARCGDCGRTRGEHVFGRDLYGDPTCDCPSDVEAAMRSHDRDVAADLRGGRM